MPACKTSLASHRRRRGIALIVVLSMLALMTVLVVAMLTQSMGESRGASGYEASGRARQLSEIAVSVAVSQIHQATQQPGMAWAVQPGAIRCYDSGGSFQKGYRLYSDSEMTVESGNEATFAGDVVPKDWNSPANLARYVDLNEPVLRGGELFAPIIDPRSTVDVDGFDFDPAQVNLAAKNGNDVKSRLPMPVEWLYVLEDGTLGTLDSGGRFGGPKPATLANPIVGRVAFWADDETSKLNVNTASEPTFWDMPRTEGDDRKYAQFQATRNEWQRFPGHPATTALSPVFFPGAASGADIGRTNKELIYDLVPRVEKGGSASATISYLTKPNIVADSQRLFATTDELLFQPGNAQPRALNPSSLINATKLQRLPFFLTSHSNAPETTLFNTPRIAMWPVGDESRYNERTRTTYDLLIAFCSTPGLWKPERFSTGVRDDYFFRRLNEDATDGDMSILRNKQLYAYLQALTGKPIPGFGGNFSAKYGADRDQILTEIYDYIRCTNLYDDSLDARGDDGGTSGVGNSHRMFTDGRGSLGHGQITPTYIAANDTLGFGRFFTLSEAVCHFICSADAGDGSSPDGVMGSNVITGANANKSLVTKLAARERRVQMALLFEFFSAMQGWAGLGGEIQIKVSGLKNLQLNNQSLFTADTASMSNKTYWGSLHHERHWAGYGGYRSFFGDQTGDCPFVSNFVTVPAPGALMNFSGGNLTVEVVALGAPSFSVQTIQLNFPAATGVMTPELVQAGTAVGPPNSAGADSAPQTQPQDWWTFETTGVIASRPYGRISTVNTNPGNGYKPADELAGSMIRSVDTMLSLIPSHSDYRLIAASRKVDKSVFKPHRDYGVKRLAHQLRTTTTAHYIPGDPSSLGKLAQNAAYGTWNAPDVRLDSPPQLWGDFDNGMSICQDGPYINKPDEGNSYQLSLGKIPYFDTNWAQDMGGLTYFSPNRQVPSSVMLGSLPSRVKAGEAWRTLLFRYQPGHPGAQSPPDHLWLDLFWMPVVEPYAVSEPFSTAGKVNLNHQLAPFSYITRTTALRGVLGDEKMLAIRMADGGIYKNDAAKALGYRKAIDRNLTLEEMNTQRFKKGRLFRSASEICEMPLIPTGETAAAMDSAAANSFWTRHSLTGDNSRERPYANIYPRVTTKSNSFRVHYRAQMLRKVRTTEPDRFEPDRDQVMAEYRGSSLVERYISSSETTIPDYGTIFTVSSEPNTLDKYYRFRTVEEKRFAP